MCGQGCDRKRLRLRICVPEGGHNAKFRPPLIFVEAPQQGTDQSHLKSYISLLPEDDTSLATVFALLSTQQQQFNDIRLISFI